MLQNYNLWKTAGLFFVDPLKPFAPLEISSKISLAHTSVKNHLHILLSLKIIKTIPSPYENRKAPLYQANRLHKQFTFYKRIFNLIELENSGILDYISKECQPDAIVLFGSFAKGEDTKESDIDLFIECKKKKIILDNFCFSRKIELHFKESFKSYPLELKNTIMNGIILRGFLEGYGEDSNKQR